jgi:hypothetical protein
MTEEKIVTAVMVTSIEKGDGTQLPKVIEHSRMNCGVCKCREQ